MKSEKVDPVRVDGINVKGKWETSGGDKLKIDDLSKDKGKGYTLAFDGKKLLGNMKEKDKMPYVCVETCEEEPTTDPPEDGECGKGWTMTKDDVCIL